MEQKRRKPVSLSAIDSLLLAVESSPNGIEKIASVEPISDNCCATRSWIDLGDRTYSRRVLHLVMTYFMQQRQTFAAHTSPVSDSSAGTEKNVSGGKNEIVDPGHLECPPLPVRTHKREQLSAEDHVRMW